MQWQHYRDNEEEGFEFWLLEFTEDLSAEVTFDDKGDWMLTVNLSAGSMEYVHLATVSGELFDRQQAFNAFGIALSHYLGNLSKRFDDMSEQVLDACAE